MHGIFFEPPIDKYFLGYQFNEIYRENVYAPFFKDRHDMTVIDIGANIGLTAYYFSHHAKIVHSIEPSMEHFKILKHMVEYNQLKNVEIHKMAIWIKNQKGKLYHNFQNKTMYSLHGAVQDQQSIAEDVNIVTLDKFFADNKIEHCDFLKLDVEGSEFEILGGSGFREVAPKIDTIFLEWHKWADRNPSQLHQALKSNGFDISVPQSGADLIVGTRK
jgi:FkbM family methyltransferase